MAKEISKKQEIFVAEYLVDQNATRAYVAAGYSATGAAQSASRLLRNPKVAELIATAQEQRMDELDISAKRVLGALASIAFDDSRKPPISDGPAKQVATADKLRALELLGRHLKMFTDKVEYAGKDGMPLNPPSLIVEFVEPGYRDGEIVDPNQIVGPEQRLAAQLETGAEYVDR